MNQQLGGIMDYGSTNNFNDEYMTELSSANINKTFFRSSNNSIITSQVGSIVHLPCRVHLIGDEMVIKKFISLLIKVVREINQRKKVSVNFKFKKNVRNS